MRTTYAVHDARARAPCVRGANRFRTADDSILAMDDTASRQLATRRRLLRSLPVPLLAAALVGGATAAASSSSPPGFDARSALHLNQQTAADPVRRVTRIVPSEVLDTLASPDLRTAVAKELGLASIASSDITISPRTGSNGDVVDITAHASTAQGADQMASTYATTAAARLEAESQERLKAAVALLDNQQQALAATQTSLARSVAALATTNPQRVAAEEQLGTLSRQRTQVTADRTNLLTTAALLGPAARGAGTLEVEQVHAVSPRLLRGTLSGLAAGLVVALGLLGSFTLRRRVPSMRAGELLEGSRVLAVVPRRVAGAGPAEVEALDRIVTELLLEQRTHGCAALAVAGATRRCVTSTTASSIAAGLARRGLRVLLVDADLRHPSQHARHGIALQPGLADVLRGTAVRTCRTTDAVEVLVAGVAGAPADLLGHQALVDLLASARREHDIVVIDVGSLENPEARLVAALADRALLCAVPGRTTADELAAATPALREDALLGLVLVDIARGSTPTPPFAPLPMEPYPSASAPAPSAVVHPPYDWRDVRRLSRAPETDFVNVTPGGTS